MKFFYLSLKMVRNNFAKYKLFFNCNCISTIIFFCLSSLVLNEQFMDGYYVDSMISSNIIFPSILMAVFMVIFLPLSYHIFWIARRQDYGILMSLGMSRKETIKNIAIESLLIAVLALIAALAAGTVCSAIFYVILKYLLNIDGWKWIIPFEAYLLTCLLYGIITIITNIVYLLKILQIRIGRMLKYHDSTENNGFLYKILQKYMPGYLNKNLIKISFLLRHKKEWNLRHIIASLLVMSVTLFISFSICIFGGLYHDVDVYAPFDMIYVELYGYNKLSIDDAAMILSVQNVSVTSSCQIEFMRDKTFNYISASELNDKLHTNYKVADGSYLNLFQFDMDDGYEHDTVPVDKITVNGSIKGNELMSAGEDINILWNRSFALADRTLILSDNDFKALYDNNNYWKGTMNLLNFMDWQHSKDGVIAVQNELQHINGLSDAEMKSLSVTSKIFDYERAKQSGSVLILSMSFVIIMLCVTVFVLLHFQIVSEKEENGQIVRSIYLLGGLKGELEKALLFKNRIHFLFPVITGGIVSIIPCYYLINQVYNFGLRGVAISVISSCIIGIATGKSLKYYTKKEFFSCSKFL